jgi:hypothetical protein
MRFSLHAMIIATGIGDRQVTTSQERHKFLDGHCGVADENAKGAY